MKISLLTLSDEENERKRTKFIFFFLFLLWGWEEAKLWRQTMCCNLFLTSYTSKNLRFTIKSILFASSKGGEKKKMKGLLTNKVIDRCESEEMEKLNFWQWERCKTERFSFYFIFFITKLVGRWKIFFSYFLQYDWKGKKRTIIMFHKSLRSFVFFCFFSFSGENKKVSIRMKNWLTIVTSI